MPRLRQLAPLQASSMPRMPQSVDGTKSATATTSGGSEAAVWSQKAEPTGTLSSQPDGSTVMSVETASEVVPDRRQARSPSGTTPDLHVAANCAAPSVWPQSLSPAAMSCPAVPLAAHACENCVCS